MSPTPTRDRFETEGLLQLEKGLPLDPEFDACEDSQRLRETYDALRERLASMPEETAPKGWEQAVWAAIDSGQELAGSSESPEDDSTESTVSEDRPRVVSLEERRVGPRRWAVGGVLGGLAAAALLVLMFQPSAPPEVAFGSVLERTATTEHRGGEARPGDTLILTAELGSYEQAELRIYRDGSELWLRCSDSPPCDLQGTSLEASIVLETRGVYQPVLLLSSQDLPAGGAGLDADAGAAIAAGARVETLAATTVR